MILFNAVLFSIIVMTILCLLRLNVLLSILISALIAGLLSSFGLVETTGLIIKGMSANLETALSYILLGAIAAAIARTNLTKILIYKISDVISNQKYIFIISIAFFACFSQNLIPVHIAFIPVLIPPLLNLMSKMKIDRRAVACALTFGLQAPYVSIGAGFGLLFYNILKTEFGHNNIEISISDIQSVMWLGGAIMLFGLICAIFYYKKPRDYKQDTQNLVVIEKHHLEMTKKEWAVLAGTIVAFGVQIYTSSIPLGGVLGLIVMIALKGIEWNKVDLVMDEGLKMMAFIAFVMLVAAGYGNVLRESGAIPEIINFASNLSGGKLGGAAIMLIIGLFITIGIGTSFGTIPIIATIYIPLCVSLGFSLPATILLVGIAAAVGDAGSPASDSTLGPTSGLNADGQHNHIYDTCVPTFVFFNIPLIVFGCIFALFL